MLGFVKNTWKKVQEADFKGVGRTIEAVVFCAVALAATLAMGAAVVALLTALPVLVAPFFVVGILASTALIVAGGIKTLKAIQAGRAAAPVQEQPAPADPWEDSAWQITPATPAFTTVKNKSDSPAKTAEILPQKPPVIG